MSENHVIRVEGLWKRYGLPFAPMLRRMLHGAPSDPEADGPWALRGLDLNVREGESLGIIGRNGAGKSTLLKVLSGVSPPTRGQVHVKGRLFPMIELNAGVHPELNGAENVYLLGSIMGFSRRMIDERIGRIEEFCGIGEWFTKPVRTYSSGMMARLGFAVAMHVEAEILLIDEVLAVGDLAFQRQCFGRLEELRRGGVTIIFVSHSIRQVERMCERAALMDKGKILRIGDSTEVANSYYEINHEAELLASRGRVSNRRSQGTGELDVTNLAILDEHDQPTQRVRLGSPVRLRLDIDARGDIPKPIIGIAFISMDMVPVTAFSNDDNPDRPSFNGAQSFGCTIPALPLAPGTYSIKLKILHQNGSVIFSSDDFESIQVLPEHEGASSLSMAGFFKLDVHWDDEPQPRGK